MIWMDNALAKIIFLLITKNILIIKYIHPNWLIFDTKQKSNYRIDVQARKKYLNQKIGKKLKSNLRNGLSTKAAALTNLERVDRKFGGGDSVSKITLKSWCYRFRNRFSWQCNGKQDRERRITAARIIRWWESRNWRIFRGEPRN